MKKNTLWRLVFPLGMALFGLFALLHSAQAASQENAIQPGPQAASLTNVITVTTTIQAAIDAAKDGDIVNIPMGWYTETLTVDKNITLHGVSPDMTILQAETGHRVITVPNEHNLRLEGLYVYHGDPITDVFGSAGGGIYATGNLQIINSIIAFNQADFGGGVYQASSLGRVDVTGGDIHNNYSTYDGGGFYVTGGIVLTDTNLSGNNASRHGGGIHAQNGSITMTGGTLVLNFAGGNGGGINANNAVTVVGTQFNNNTSGQDGGGLLQWNSGQAVNVTDASFQRNLSYGNGGGIWARGNLTVTNTAIISNTAGVTGVTSNVYGGGIYLSTGSLLVSRSTFRGNELDCSCPSPSGGGLFVDTTKPVSIQHSTFDSNHAWNGGGLFYTKYDILIRGSTFKGNQAGYGGAVNILGGTIQESDFINNYASNMGGALNAVSLVQMTGSRFIDNSTTYVGGSAIGGNLSLQAVNTLFANNHSDFGGSVLRLTGPGSSTLEHVTIASPVLDTTNSPAAQVISGTLSITNTVISKYHIGVKADKDSVVYDDYNLYFGNWVDFDKLGGGTIHFGSHDIGLIDPLFVNPALVDYHLRAGSGAINRGKNLGIPVDLDGMPRDAKPDIGSYEYWCRIYLPTVKK